MLKKFFKSTEDLIDKKLKNGTVMVVIISTLIIITGFLSVGGNMGLTANILESQKDISIKQYILIDGKKYKITLEEIK